MNLKEWIVKLSKPHWMPEDPRIRIHNLTPKHVGQLNLMWVFAGRKPITQGFFDRNLNLWDLAGRICVQTVDNIPVREYATLFTEQEFYQFVKQHPEVFERYMPMSAWSRHFRAGRLHGA